MSAATRVLTVGEKANCSTFILSSTSLRITRKGDRKWPEIDTPLRNVVWAELAEELFEVTVLAKKNDKSRLSLVHITGRVNQTQLSDVTSFVGDLISVAYKGSKPRKCLRVLINPHGGPGKALSQYRKIVEPLFRAARCTVDVTTTTHSKHAQELAQTIVLGKYDALVVVSGDGLVHEVMNGFAVHAQPTQALKIPLVQIPTGSGNGLSLNVLGLKDGLDLAAAALNALKGRPMKVDVFSMTQGDTRVLSFFTQAIGLMADLDLGTENLRFLGDTRFVVGFLRGLIKQKPCPVKLTIKVVESDKTKMVQSLHAAHASAAHADDSAPEVVAPISTDKSSEPATQSTDTAGEQEDSALPPLRYAGAAGNEGWVTFDRPVLYMYAGKGPYVSRDLMQFPVSVPDDGTIDIVVQEISTRGAMLDAMDGAEKGDAFWMDTQHYFKAEAFRVEPHSPKGNLSVDGERYPFVPFQIEVHRGLATFLSPYGVYRADFEMKK